MSDPTKVSRRLVAVFAADVEGYSRLMGADEVGTLKGLTERRAILDRLIGDHGGRIANTAGDSVLAEFGSAVDAIECAVEAQTAFAEANSSVAPEIQTTPGFAMDCSRAAMFTPSPNRLQPARSLRRCARQYES